MGDIAALEYPGYRVVSRIARGGMGEVYEAEDLRLGRRVALKVIEQRRSEDRRAERRFEREARALQRIVHPNVVPIYAATFARPRSFIVMELLRGETLGARLARDGRLPLQVVIGLFLPLVSGVQALHDAGIIHRDLKLSNVMLVERSHGVEPVILDLGVSRFLSDDEEDSALTHTEGVLGTMRYLSPEQTINAKSASPRSDQYALGLMLYECVTGERPFSGASPYEVMHAIVNSSLPPVSTWNSELPGALDAVLARAMNRDAMRRYASVADFGTALLPFADADVRSCFEQKLASMRSDDSRLEDDTEVDSRQLRRSRSAWSAPSAELGVAAPHARRRVTLAASVVAAGVATGIAVFALRSPAIPTTREEEPRSPAPSQAYTPKAEPVPAATASAAPPGPPLSSWSSVSGLEGAALPASAASPPKVRPRRAGPKATASARSGAGPATRPSAAPPSEPVLGKDDAIEAFDLP
jgi:eukaryotic-like serine/threonine-protein kinase